MRPTTVLHAADLHRARAILRGDEAAFAAFYNETFPRLFRYAQRQGLDPDRAEEATQDTLVLALEKLAGYRGEASLLTWVFTLARHALQRRGQREARQCEWVDEDALEAVLARLNSLPEHDPAGLAARQQLVQQVHAVLDRLPSPYAECLEGKYVLGLSMRELAVQLGRSEKAIESILGRARDAFRAAFAGAAPVLAEAGR